MTEQRKKLSEIGETVMIHLNKGNEPHEWLTEVHMSVQERRELVRQSVFMFIMDFISSYDLGRGDSLGDAMTEFFKEQGL